MIKDGFLGIGVWLGFNLGWFIEKHYVDFSTECSILTKIIRAIFGVVTVYLIFYMLGSYYYKILPNFYARMCQWASMMLYTLAIYPIIFNFIEKRIQANQNKTKETQNN